MENPKNEPLDPLKVQLWIHQSGLLWSRLQTVSAIQVGAFTGWYFLRGIEVGLSTLLMALALLLTLFMSGIVCRDIAYLDAFGSSIKAQVPKGRISGRGCAYALLVLLLLSNLILALSPLLCLRGQPPQEHSEEKPATLQTPIDTP